MQSGWQPPPQYQHQPYYGHGPVPSWARPPIDKRLLRPKAWWYALSAIPLLLGIGLAALLVVLAIHAFPDEPRPFLTSSALILHLNKGDDQTIWRQTRGAAVPELAGTPSCSVRDDRTERALRVRPSGNTTLTINDNRYVSELDFDVPAEGVYRVRCRPAFGPGPQPLAVGKRPHLARFGALIVGAIAAFVLGVLLCGGAIALVAVLRHRHKRRLQDEAMGIRR